jgi:HAE1 family hydrophobic/amphiphilic exporter-1
MVTLPLAVIGVSTALWLTKKTLNIGVLMGLVMLGGIVVNNAIILMDYTNRLRKTGLGSYRAVITAAIGRLRPIMITTFTTILGLLPMAMDKSEQANLWSPLAITVISGLITSTLFTPFIIPCTYIIFQDINRRFKHT